MKNGKIFKFGVAPLRYILSLVLVATVLMPACRSSRNTVEETHREEHTSNNVVVKSDTLKITESLSETQTDTAGVLADERRVISLKRDSAGRVVEIREKSIARIDGSAMRKTEHDRWFFGLNATRYSEAAATVDSITQKKEEEKKDYKLETPLELRIVLIFAAVAIVLYMGSWFHKIINKKWIG